MSVAEQGLTDEQARLLAQYVLLKQQWLKTWGIIVQTNRTIKYQAPATRPPEPRAYLILTEMDTESALQTMARRVEAIMPDLISALLGTASCVLLGIATGAEAVAAPATGGASLVFASLTYGGAVASAAGAGISWGRVINGLTDPELNEILDSELYCQEIALGLDVLSLGSLTIARYPVIAALINESKVTGKSISQLIRGMNRASRKRVAQELMRAAGDTGKSIDVSTVNAVIRKQLLEAMSTALSVLGSAYSGGLNKAYSVTTALVR